jgi:dihydrofolate reductase
MAPTPLPAATGGRERVWCDLDRDWETELRSMGMRKVALTMSVTLDGYGAGPNDEMDWVTDSLNEEILGFVGDQLSANGGLLLGRVTYQIWAGYWPYQTGSIAEKIGNALKIVFSRTLDSVDWKNTRLVKGDVAEEVRKLKAQPGKELMLQGGVGLAQTFINLGLVDEYRLLVYPVVLGAGKPLFRDVRDRLPLTLTESRTFSNGAVLLIYRPANTGST